MRFLALNSSGMVLYMAKILCQLVLFWKLLGGDQNFTYTHTNAHFLSLVFL